MAYHTAPGRPASHEEKPSAFPAKAGIQLSAYERLLCGSRLSPGMPFLGRSPDRDCFAALAMTERAVITRELLVETVRVVCAHDCPDMCSLLAEVEDGRVRRVRGDPEQPFTAGFACAKVNRDAELVHSPERLRSPLRRTGAKGEGAFAPISWDEALDEIAARWRQVIA